MDALGISMGEGLGILAGTEVAQKISDNILAGNFISNISSNNEPNVSLTISGFTKFFIIMSRYTALTSQSSEAIASDHMCSIVKSTGSIYFSYYGFWRTGNLYSRVNSWIAATLIAIE